MNVGGRRTDAMTVVADEGQRAQARHAQEEEATA
jgi:hypothetical protein